MNPSIYTYVINSHGEIVTTFDPDADVEELVVFPIHIPKNIEIMTYTSLGESYWEACTVINFQCNKKKNLLLPIKTPIHKYKKRFPEIKLTPDDPTSSDDKIPKLPFYSGIVHCIPEGREDSSKKKEIIHNMDADPLKDCGDDSIFPYYSRTTTPSVKRPYYSTNKYSEDYVKVLEKKNGNFRDFPLHKIKKCGPLVLSEAIKIIIQHCRETYKEDYSKSIIQIHLTACLVFAENPIDYNAGMKTVNDLRYFTSNSSNIDPKIKDTSHIKTYTFTFGKKVFIIEVPKSKSKSKSKSYTGDGINIHENNFEKKLFSALLNALKIINIKDIDLLPDEITLSIPEGRTMEEEDIKNYILDILNKLIRDSKKMKKLDFLWDKIGWDPIAWDAIEKELDEKDRRLEEKEERLEDQAEKELYDLLRESAAEEAAATAMAEEAAATAMAEEAESTTTDREKKSKTSRKAQEMSSSNESMHSTKKHRVTSKGGQKIKKIKKITKITKKTKRIRKFKKKRTKRRNRLHI
jgi:hypothetical protein